MASYQCPYCSEDNDNFSTPSEKLLLNHIKIVHSTDAGFMIQCSLCGCSRTFTNFKAFQNHRRIKHKYDEGLTTIEPCLSSLVENSSDDTDQSMISITHRPMQSFSSKWILKTRETRKRTRSAMQGVIDDVGELVTFVTQSLESQTRALLLKSGASSQWTCHQAI